MKTADIEVGAEYGASRTGQYARDAYRVRVVATRVRRRASSGYYNDGVAVDVLGRDGTTLVAYDPDDPQVRCVLRPQEVIAEWAKVADWLVRDEEYTTTLYESHRADARAVWDAQTRLAELGVCSGPRGDRDDARDLKLRLSRDELVRLLEVLEGVEAPQH